VVEHLSHALLLQTLTLSLATLVVRALQATLLRRLGAASAYLGWLLVPVAMLAVALPHPAIDALVIRVDVAAIAPAWAAGPVASIDTTHALELAAIAAWLAGVSLFAATMLHRQRRFEALIDDVAQRLPAGAGPAVLGVLKRRILLPRDFDSAFDADERRLMLLHEGVHLRRADNAWNLLATALLVLHWFNPIAWWAWRRVRADQEMSCDAAVLREESPGALAVYAGALLKVQGVALTPPLATAWQSIHPFVERVRMLQRHRISSTRHRAGLRVAALSILVAGFGGYALQAGASATAAAAPADAKSVMTDIQVVVAGSSTSTTTVALQVLARAGELATLRLDPKSVKGLGEPLQIAYTASRLDDEHLQIDTTLSWGSPLALLGSPRLITQNGVASTVQVKAIDGRVFTLTFVPKPVASPLVATDGAADARKPQAGAPPQRAL
jgi:beta-lactamase regulating signal transducer with metallopeptidase domain